MYQRQRLRKTGLQENIGEELIKIAVTVFPEIGISDNSVKISGVMVGVWRPFELQLCDRDRFLPNFTKIRQSSAKIHSPKLAKLAKFRFTKGLQL